MNSGKKSKPSARAPSAATRSSLKKSDRASLVAVPVRDALAVIFAVRFANALCVRTFFQPDEYFQALEPAWNMLFGNEGGAWITWEWKHQLRSSIHPAVFAFGYWVVEQYAAAGMSPITKAKWLIAAPKLLQTAFAALSDLYSWRLAEKLYGHGSVAAWSVLLMTLLNPWQWYTSTRTFSNCFETTLTAMALYYFPWSLLGTEDDGNSKSKYSSVALFKTWGQVNSLRLSLILAAFAVLLRPTNVLIWLAIATLALTRATLDGKSPLTQKNLLIVYREVLLCGSFALGLSLLADRQYYGEWTFPPLTFLHFNVAQDLAVFYGQNDWHYYLSQGIPLLCTTIAPFVVKGLFKSLDAESNWPITTSNALKALSFTVFTTICSLSFVSHKEVRFITPLLPAFHILAAPYITSFFTTVTDVTSTPTSTLGWKRTPLLAAGLLVNAVIGGYLSYFHAAAPIGVMDFLRTEFETIHPTHLAIPQPPNANAAYDDDFAQELFALFLTPCHATPWRSHLVYPALRARALTCDPPVNTLPGSPERASYQDETRRFYADSPAFLGDLWPRDRPGEDMARYIVGYEGIEAALREYFDWSGPGGRHKVELKEVWSSWNGLFTDDDRKAGRLVVWATGFYDKPSTYEP
ncbi:glycosyltransferase family 22 protein [Annulohypoxylon maeteangense]|uniref:glycosyltransferase family 22 protein n=1 Tax=Annulohypoxylon maeteangense TaxID=1927788 RepID=UPI0020080DA0|nr:glycosyltransferase family 22 protein [Annulohypoxylon maeteangense]KAI0887497.1 glycosyltransferase family 22 protein [Annulohypoxylon maeteangense]